MRQLDADCSGAPLRPENTLYLVLYIYPIPRFGLLGVTLCSHERMNTGNSEGGKLLNVSQFPF